MAIAALVSLPFIPIVAFWERRKKSVLAESMTRTKRALLWPDFVRALEEKHGTLIVEGDPRKGPNLWWTTESVSAVSPHRCSCDLGSLFDRNYRPFRMWCYERYISPTTGTAFLVLGGEGHRRGFAIGTDEEDIGSGIFQNVPTVLIGRRGR